MQLADVYAEKADAWTRGELNPQVVDQHRAALVAAIESLQAENERLKLALLGVSEATKDREHAEKYFRQAEAMLTGNERTLMAERDALQARINELEALSVTNILLDVTPGDGSGYEVYAKSVKDVVNTLTKLSEIADAHPSQDTAAY
jgi:alkanesulfonate monooxygenase SsuD/methylene tetrahydromethanopterin reductase-like flavin-dependent oxidoreductase (luciferase family)